MLQRNRFAIFMLIVLAVSLPGCGGSGSGSKGGGSGLTGSVTGRVATLPSGGGTVTASIDGQNISAPVAADGSFSLPSVPPGVYTLVLPVIAIGRRCCRSRLSGKVDQCRCN